MFCYCIWIPFLKCSTLNTSNLSYTFQWVYIINLRAFILFSTLNFLILWLQLTFFYELTMAIIHEDSLSLFWVPHIHSDCLCKMIHNSNTICIHTMFYSNQCDLMLHGISMFGYNPLNNPRTCIIDQSMDVLISQSPNHWGLSRTSP